MAALCSSCRGGAQAPGLRTTTSSFPDNVPRPPCSLSPLGRRRNARRPARTTILTPLRPSCPDTSSLRTLPLASGASLNAASSSGETPEHRDRDSSSREREGGGEVEGGNPAAFVQESLSAALDKAMDSEESKELLRDLVAAEERVARAKAEMEEIERQEKQLQRLRQELELQNEADSRLAAAEKEVTKLLSTVNAAEEEVRLAGAALLKARSGMGSGLSAERIESAKAGAAAAAGGTLAYLPLMLGRDFSSLAFGVTSVALTCALFGVTFRYAVRRDANNVHLKSGVVGAFALAQALARVDGSIVERVSASVSVEDILPSVLSSGGEAVAILAAALSLEYCLQQGVVQRFPSD